MNPISTTYRGADIIFEVRNPEEGHFYAEGTVLSKIVGELRVRSGRCTSYEEANQKLLQCAQTLIDEAQS